MNSRLDEIQAAILRVKLAYLDQENSQRRELARLYDDLLAATPLTLPQRRDGVEHVYHQYVVRSQRRDELRSFLKDNSVGTLIHYPAPVHAQPAYQKRAIIDPGGLSCTEQVCREIVSLPMYPQLTVSQVRHVGELIKQWCEQ
jgi:dTDP-4-amino-4,6-dideoxygalactose transaminase